MFYFFSTSHLLIIAFKTLKPDFFFLAVVHKYAFSNSFGTMSNNAGRININWSIKNASQIPLFCNTILNKNECFMLYVLFCIFILLNLKKSGNVFDFNFFLVMMHSTLYIVAANIFCINQSFSFYFFISFYFILFFVHCLVSIP